MVSPERGTEHDSVISIWLYVLGHNIESTEFCAYGCLLKGGSVICCKLTCLVS